MGNSSYPFNIIGQEPPKAGQECQGFYLQHFIENGVITDQANVAYFKFTGEWYSLSFEAGTVFWRRHGAEPPVEPVNSTLANTLVLNNLSEMDGIAGQILEDIQYSRADDSLIVKLCFAGGRTLVFRYMEMEDRTEICV